MADRPDHRGIGGRITVERVAECSWNRWPNARGKHNPVCPLRPEHKSRAAEWIKSKDLLGDRYKAVMAFSIMRCAA